MSPTRTVVFYIAGLFLVLVIKNHLTEAVSFKNETLNLAKSYSDNGNIKGNTIFMGPSKSLFERKKNILNSTSLSDQVSKSGDKKISLTKVGKLIGNWSNNYSRGRKSKIAQNHQMLSLRRRRRSAELAENPKCDYGKTAKEADSEACRSLKRRSARRKEHSSNVKKYRSKLGSKDNSPDDAGMSPSKSRKKMKKIKNKNTSPESPYPKDRLQNKMMQNSRPYGQKSPSGRRKGNKNLQKNQSRKPSANQNAGLPKKTNPYRTGGNKNRKPQISQADKNLAVMKGNRKNNFKPLSAASRRVSKHKETRLKKHGMYANQNGERINGLYPKSDDAKNLKLREIVPKIITKDVNAESENKYIIGDDASLNGHSEQEGMNIYEVDYGGNRKINKHHTINSNFQKTEREIAEVKNSSKMTKNVKSVTNDSTYNPSESKNVEGSAKQDVRAVQTLNQTNKPEDGTTKGSTRLSRYLFKKLKPKRKVGLHSSYHAKKSIETRKNSRKLRFLKGLGRSIRNANDDILNEVKDFLLKNFPSSKYRRTPEANSRRQKKKTNKTVLNQLKEFLINNFHSDRTKRNSSETTNLPQLDDIDATQSSAVDVASYPDTKESVTSGDYDADEKADEIKTGTETKDNRRFMKSASKEHDYDANEENMSADIENKNSESDMSKDDSVNSYLNEDNTEDYFEDEVTSESTRAHTNSLTPVVERSLNSGVLKNKQFQNSKRDVRNTSKYSHNASDKDGHKKPYNTSNLSKVRNLNSSKSNENIKRNISSSSTHVPTPTGVLNENTSLSAIDNLNTSSTELNSAVSTETILDSKNNPKVSRGLKRVQSEGDENGLKSTQLNAHSGETAQEISSEYQDSESILSEDENHASTLNSLDRNQLKNNKDDEEDDEDLQSKDEYSPALLKPELSSKSPDLDKRGEDYNSKDTVEVNDSEDSKEIEDRKDKHSSENFEKEHKKSANAPEGNKNNEEFDSKGNFESDDSKKREKADRDSEEKMFKTYTGKSKNSLNVDKNDEDYDSDDAVRSIDSKMSKTSAIDSKDKNSLVNSKAENGMPKDLEESDKADEDYASKDTPESNNSKVSKSVEIVNEDESSSTNNKKDSRKSKSSPDLVKKDKDYDFKDIDKSKNSKMPKNNEIDSENEESSLISETGNTESRDSLDSNKNDEDYESEDTVKSNNFKISKAAEIDREDRKSPQNVKTDDTILTDLPDLYENDEDYDSEDTVESSNSKIPKTKKIDNEDENSLMNNNEDNRKAKNTKHIVENDEDFDSEDTVEANKSKVPETKVIDNEDDNSPMNNDEVNRKVKNLKHLARNDEDYDSPGVIESNNYEIPNSIDVNNGDEYIEKNSKLSNRMSKTSSDLDENEDDDFEDLSGDETSPINSKLDKGKSNSLSDLYENNEYDETVANMKTEKRKSSDLNKNLEDYDYEYISDESNSKNSKARETSDKNKHFHASSKINKTNSMDSQTLVENEEDKDSEDKLEIGDFKNPKVTEINSKKRKSSAANSKHIKDSLNSKKNDEDGNFEASDDSSLHDSEVDFDSDASYTAEKFNELSKNMDEADNEGSFEENSNNKNEIRQIKTSTATSSSEKAETFPNESPVSLRSLDYTSTSKKAKYDDSNITHTVALKNVKVQQTTTPAYSEDRDAKAVQESATRPKKEYENSMDTDEKYDNSNDTDDEYDYDKSELKLNPSTDLESKRMSKLSRANDESASIDKSKPDEKQDREDEVKAPGGHAQGSASVSARHKLEKHPKHDAGNESASLNMVKAHQADENELASKSETNSPTIVKSMKQKSILSDTISEYSKADSHSDKNTDKVKSTDMKEEDKEKIEGELSKSMTEASSSLLANSKTSESATDDPENNLDIEKKVEEEKSIQDSESLASENQRSQETYSGKTKTRRGEDKETSLLVLKRFLNSLIHAKIEERRNKHLQAINTRKIRRTRDTLSVELTTFPEVATEPATSKYPAISSAKSWIFGIAGLVIMTLFTMGIYRLVVERFKKNRLHDESLNSRDLKEVFVDDDDGTSDLMLPVDDDDTADMCNRWDNDGRHLHNVISRALQNSDIPENETIKNKYSAIGHISKINLAMRGTLE